MNECISERERERRAESGDRVRRQGAETGCGHRVRRGCGDRVRLGSTRERVCLEKDKKRCEEMTELVGCRELTIKCKGAYVYYVLRIECVNRTCSK